MTSTDELLSTILEENRRLREEVSKMNERLENIEESCDRMDNHIGFIHRVYHFMKGKITWMLGSKQLPALEDSPK